MYDDFQIGGSWKENALALPLIYVKICDVETEKKHGVKCASKTEIQNTRLFLSSIIQRNVVKYKDYKDPIKNAYYFERNEIDLSGNNNKKGRVFFNRASLSTDTGSIIQNWNNEPFFEFESYRVEPAPKPSEVDLGPNVISLEFYLSYALTNHFRDYGKIVDNLGFFWVFLLVLEEILRLFYNQFLQRKYLAYAFSAMFHLEEIQEDQSFELQKVVEKGMANNAKINARRSGSVEIKANVETEEDLVTPGQISEPLPTEKDVIVSPRKMDSDDNENEILRYRDLKTLINCKKAPKVVHEIEICELGCNYACCVKREGEYSKNSRWLRFELINNADMTLKRKMNIFEMQRTLDRYELLEKMFLNHGQHIMLHNKGRQSIISVTKEANKVARDFHKINQEKNTQFLKKYIKKLKKNDCATEEDNLLFLHMDPDLQEIIKKEGFIE